MSDYWLDGTTAGTHIEDLADVPPFGFALPLTAGGNDLDALPVRRPERPQIAVAIDYDQSAGTAFPPLLDLSFTVRGQIIAPQFTLQEPSNTDHTRAFPHVGRE